MNEITRGEVTRLLMEDHASGPEVIHALVPLLYRELQDIARRHLAKEGVGHTLNTTALVHEAYLDLVDRDKVRMKDRSHFLAAASRVMRHILVDHARSRNAQKRGGGAMKIPLQEVEAGILDLNPDLLDLDRALEALMAHDQEMMQIVECRFFGGLTVEETAEALDISPRTVRRKWTRARVYLLDYLEGGTGG